MKAHLTRRYMFSASHRLHSDAAAFGLRFSVERADTLDVPAFTGATSVNAALPLGG